MRKSCLKQDSPGQASRARWQLLPKETRRQYTGYENGEGPLRYAVKEIGSQHLPQGKFPRYVLGYWNIRGICDWIRMLFYYHDVPYLERIYPYKDMMTWERDKYALPKMRLPNLPFLMVLPDNVDLLSGEMVEGKTVFSPTHMSPTSNHAMNKTGALPTVTPPTRGAVSPIRLLSGERVHLSSAQDLKTLRSLLEQSVGSKVLTESSAIGWSLARELPRYKEILLNNMPKTEKTRGFSEGRRASNVRFQSQAGGEQENATRRSHYTSSRNRSPSTTNRKKPSYADAARSAAFNRPQQRREGGHMAGSPHDDDAEESLTQGLDDSTVEEHEINPVSTAPTETVVPTDGATKPPSVSPPRNEEGRHENTQPMWATSSGRSDFQNGKSRQSIQHNDTYVRSMNGGGDHISGAGNHNSASPSCSSSNKLILPPLLESSLPNENLIGLLGEYMSLDGVLTDLYSNFWSLVYSDKMNAGMVVDVDGNCYNSSPDDGSPKDSSPQVTWQVSQTGSQSGLQKKKSPGTRRGSTSPFSRPTRIAQPSPKQYDKREEAIEEYLESLTEAGCKFRFLEQNFFNIEAPGEPETTWDVKIQLQSREQDVDETENANYAGQSYAGHSQAAQPYTASQMTELPSVVGGDTRGYSSPNDNRPSQFAGSQSAAFYEQIMSDGPDESVTRSVLGVQRVPQRDSEVTNAPDDGTATIEPSTDYRSMRQGNYTSNANFYSNNGNNATDGAIANGSEFGGSSNGNTVKFSSRGRRISEYGNFHEFNQSQWPSEQLPAIHEDGGAETILLEPQYTDQFANDAHDMFAGLAAPTPKPQARPREMMPEREDEEYYSIPSKGSLVYGNGCHQTVDDEACGDGPELHDEVEMEGQSEKVGDETNEKSDKRSSKNRKPHLIEGSHKTSKEDIMEPLPDLVDEIHGGSHAASESSSSDSGSDQGDKSANKSIRKSSSSSSGSDNEKSINISVKESAKKSLKSPEAREASDNYGNATSANASAKNNKSTKGSAASGKQKELAKNDASSKSGTFGKPGTSAKGSGSSSSDTSHSARTLEEGDPTNAKTSKRKLSGESLESLESKPMGKTSLERPKHEVLEAKKSSKEIAKDAEGVGKDEGEKKQEDAGSSNEENSEGLASIKPEERPRQTAQATQCLEQNSDIEGNESISQYESENWQSGVRKQTSLTKGQGMFYSSNGSASVISKSQNIARVQAHKLASIKPGEFDDRFIMREPDPKVKIQHSMVKSSSKPILSPLETNPPQGTMLKKTPSKQIFLNRQEANVLGGPLRGNNSRNEEVNILPEDMNLPISFKGTYEDPNMIRPRRFLLSDLHISVLDFKLWSLLDYHLLLDPTALDPFPSLVEFYKDLARMEFIRRFTLDGQRDLPVPLFGAAAQFSYSVGYREERRGQNRKI